MPEDIEDRIKKLEDFKTKVELGSWWLKCISYGIGSLIVTIAAAVTAIKDWPFKGH